MGATLLFVRLRKGYHTQPTQMLIKREGTCRSHNQSGSSMQVQRRRREFPPRLRLTPSPQHHKPFKMRLAQCLIMEILAVPTTFEHYQRPILVIETGLTETDVKMPAGSSRIAMYVFAWSFYRSRHKNCQLGYPLRPCHSLQVRPRGKSSFESTQDERNLAKGIAKRLHISFKTPFFFRRDNGARPYMTMRDTRAFIAVMQVCVDIILKKAWNCPERTLGTALSLLATKWVSP